MGKSKYRYRDFCAQVARRALNSGSRPQKPGKFQIADVTAILDALIEQVFAYLVENPDERIRLPGFGLFRLCHYKARNKENPFAKPGQSRVTKVPPKSYIRFRPYRQGTNHLQVMIDERNKRNRSKDGNAFLP